MNSLKKSTNDKYILSLLNKKDLNIDTKNEIARKLMKYQKMKYALLEQKEEFLGVLDNSEKQNHMNVSKLDKIESEIQRLIDSGEYSIEKATEFKNNLENQKDRIQSFHEAILDLFAYQKRDQELLSILTKSVETDATNIATTTQKFQQSIPKINAEGMLLKIMVFIK